jgi:hypothetical protein
MYRKIKWKQQHLFIVLRCRATNLSWKNVWEQAGLTLKDIVVKTENADIKSSSAEIVSKGNSTFSIQKSQYRNGKMESRRKCTFDLYEFQFQFYRCLII